MQECIKDNDFLQHPEIFAYVDGVVTNYMRVISNFSHKTISTY